MVSGNEDHFFPVPGTAQDLLHDRVLHGRPLYAASHRPKVDDVADQKEVIAFKFPQKIKQPISLATSRAQVDVGEEY